MTNSSSGGTSDSPLPSNAPLEASGAKAPGVLITGDWRTCWSNECYGEQTLYKNIHDWKQECVECGLQVEVNRDHD